MQVKNIKETLHAHTNMYKMINESKEMVCNCSYTFIYGTVRVTLQLLRIGIGLSDFAKVLKLYLFHP